MGIFNGNSILVYLDDYGFIFLIVATFLSLFKAILDIYHEQSCITLVKVWKLIVDIIDMNDLSENNGSWQQITQVFYFLTLSWGAVRLYAHTLGLTFHTLLAKWVATNHVVIIAGEMHDAQSYRYRHTHARRRASTPTSSGRSGQSPSPLSLGGDEDEADNREDVSRASFMASFAIELAFLLARNNQVVLYLPGLDSTTRSRLWEGGVYIMAEHRDFHELLLSAGIARAKMLIAMQTYCMDNIALALSALSKEYKNSKLMCKVMMEPLEAMEEMRMEDYFLKEQLSRVRVFNESELIARCILRDHPPDQLVAKTDEQVNVLLMGLGSVGKCLVQQLAKIGHYRSKKPPRITIVDQRVTERWRQLYDAHPQITDWLEIETVERNLRNLTDGDMNSLMKRRGPFSIMYATTKDHIMNLRAARLFGRATADTVVNGKMAKIVALETMKRSVLSVAAPEWGLGERFRLFSLVHPDRPGETSRIVSALLTDIDDNRAIMTHAFYCNANPGETNRDNYQVWRELDETARNANRATADHYNVKLRAVGMHLKEAGKAKEAKLTPEEVELLAEMEHNRWWAEKSLAGFRYAKVRNNTLKHHPDMIPFHKLDEATKQKDRDGLNAMIEILRQEGVVLERDEEEE